MQISGYEGSLKKRLWRMLSRSVIATVTATLGLVVLLGTKPFIHHCGYELQLSFPLQILISLTLFMVFCLLLAIFNALGVFNHGLPHEKLPSVVILLFLVFVCLGTARFRRYETPFLNGAKDRLMADVDLAQLQQWAEGVTPNHSRKEADPIDLPSGEIIVTNAVYGDASYGDGAEAYGDGSFMLLPRRLPLSLAKAMQPPPEIIVHGSANPQERYVEIGYRCRFGLLIVVGPGSTNYFYARGSSAVKCADGIYVVVGGGG